MPRPHTLDQDPERIELLAQLIAEAVPRAKMAEAMGVAESTISEWKKDERVQKAATKIMRERANKVRAHTDTRILKILESQKELTPDVLLRIRAEFSDGVMDDNSGDGMGVLMALMKQADKDPVLARALERAMAAEHVGA